MPLLAHWKCDENQGRDVTTVADSSGHPNNHDFTSVGYSSSSVGFGNWNRHANRASGDRHISVNNNADFLLTGNMTIMAWIRPTLTANNNKYIVACGAGGTSEVQADNILWSLVWNTSNQFGMHWEQGAGVDVTAFSTTAPLIVKNEDPIHIAVVRSINGAQRDVKFFLNGVDLAEDVTGLTAPDGGSSAVCEMLRLPGADSNIPGANIWGVRVYDTAELAAAVQAVYNAGPVPYRLAYTPNPAEPLIQYQGLNFGAYEGEEYALGFERPGAGAYAAVPTGSGLDLEERPNSGWAQAGP